MKLSNLKLNNFKGIRDFSLDLNGENVTIYGANEAGKTTLVDAVLWLLFDKDSLNQKQFEIKTLNDGVPIPGIEHTVEASFILDDGVLVKLAKVYLEVWTKKRGQAQKKFTGHTTKYYIDDVPVKLKDYKAKVAEIATQEDIFQLLTSPTFFCTKLDWKKQRQKLLDVCGDISDADVIASSPELAKLPGLLNGKSTDDYKLIIASQRKKINEDLNSIPDRIDEVTRNLPELTVTNSEKLISDLTKLRTKLSKRNQEITTIKAGGGVAELTLELTGIEGRIQAIKNKHDQDTGAALQKYRDDLNEKKDLAAEQKRVLQAINSEAGTNNSEITNLNEANDHLRLEFKAVSGQAFTEESCPTCGQDLPAKDIEAAREKFNTVKAVKLEKINASGQANAKKIAELTEKNTVLENNLKNTQGFIAARENEIAELERRIAAAGVEPEYVKVIKNKEYICAQEEKEGIEQRISTLNMDNGQAAQAVEKAIQAIESEIELTEKCVAAIEQSHKGQDRIAELKAQEKKLSAEYENLEGQLFLIEQFIRAKVSMLEEKINNKFELVKFKLFAEQINGGLAETCEVTMYGVPYNSLNGAGRIQAGLDIIRTLSDDYGFHPCVIVDNRESVTDIPDMDCQVISLVVSPADDVLRIETDKALAEAA